MKKIAIVFQMFLLVFCFTHNMHGQSDLKKTEVYKNCADDGFFIDSPFKIQLNYFSIYNDSVHANISIKAIRQTKMEVSLKCELIQKMKYPFISVYKLKSNIALPLIWEKDECNSYEICTKVPKVEQNGNGFELFALISSNNSNRPEQVYYKPIDNLYVTGLNNLSQHSSTNNQESEISISPNPTNGEVIIKNAGNSDIKIYNSQGQLLKVIKSNQEANRVDLSEFVSGEYYIALSLSGKEVTKKIILKK